MSGMGRMGVSRWKLMALCCLSQNMSVGVAFGSFGPLLASTEEYFGISRTFATIGMSLITLTMGLLAPLLGGALARHSIGQAMAIAALASATGYFGLAFLPDFRLALPMYILVGAGIAVLGILGPATLVNRWYQTGRGRVLGIINLPLALFVLPFVLAELLPITGRSGILSGLGVSFLLLAPLVLLINERPPESASTSGGGVGGAPSAVAAPQSDMGMTLAEALRSTKFWLLCLGIGMVNATATVFVVHIVPFGKETGLTLEGAAALLSAFAAAGLLGTPLFGWVVDRLRGAGSLFLVASLQAIFWLGLLFVPDNALLMLAALLGLCAVPINVLHQAALSELLEPASISRGLGISYAIKLPFIFTFAPLAALLFERSESYRLPFMMTSGMLMVASTLFLVASLIRTRPSVPAHYVRL